MALSIYDFSLMSKDYLINNTSAGKKREAWCIQASYSYQKDKAVESDPVGAMGLLPA